MSKKLMGSVCLAIVIAIGFPFALHSAGSKASTINSQSKEENTEVQLVHGIYLEQNDELDQMLNSISDITPTNVENSQWGNQILKSVQGTAFQASASDKAVGALLADCGSEDAFEGLKEEKHGFYMQVLYNKLRVLYNNYYSNGKDATKYELYKGDFRYIAGKINISDYNLTEDELCKAYFAFYEDHPLLYWVESEFYYTEDELVAIIPDEYRAASVRKEYNKKILGILDQSESSVNGMDTNYEIAKTIYQSIMDKVSYAEDDMYAIWAHNIIGYVDDNINQVVCEGYAKVYQLILNYLDVDNVYVIGWGFSDASQLNKDYTKNDEYLHAWNMVQMGDGNFYYADSTWDDVVSVDGEYDYFVAGEDSFLKEHRPMKPNYSWMYYLHALPPVPAQDYVFSEEDTFTAEADPKYTKTKMLDAAVITLTSTPVYNGKAQTPAIKVTLDGVTLTKGTDYSVAYSNNINASSTAKITISPLGSCVRSKSKYFTIKKATQQISGTASYTKVYGSSAFYLNVKRTVGNGALSYKSANTAVATVSSSGGVSIKGCGTVKLTCTAAATTNYAKTIKTVTLTVKPKKESLVSVTSTTKKQMTVKWSKDTKVTGYQIQYSTNSGFSSGNKIITVSGNSNVSKVISSLTSGKRYYVRIRGYHTKGSSTLYGDYSSVRYVTVK